MVLKNTLPALLALTISSRRAAAVPPPTYDIYADTDFTANQAVVNVFGATEVAATITGVSNTVNAYSAGATAYVIGSQNSVRLVDGATGVPAGPSNSLFVTSAVGVYNQGDTGGYAEVGDKGYLQAYLTSGTINANFRLGGATITATLSGGNYNQLDPNPSPAQATQLASVFIYGSGITATQNVFGAIYTGDNNVISVLPGPTNTATSYSQRPFCSVLGSNNYVTVQGAQTSSGDILPGLYGPAFTLRGNNNLVVMSDHAVGVASNSGNLVVVKGSYRPTLFVGSGAIGLVSATGAVVFASQGGTIIATEPPAGPTVTPRLHRRGPVVNLELNSINVFPTGVAIVSGPDQSALVKPFGTLTDLGDAQVSVSSGGFAAISPNSDPLGYTATFNAGATASIAINAKAVLQDGAVLQIPPMAVSRTTRIDGTDQSLVEVFAASGVAGRARQRRMQEKRDEASARCTGGLTFCPVGHEAFECIDTASSLESCGGCWWNSEGQDCSQIEGADDVECVQGSCVVLACARGFAVSKDQATCVMA